MGKETDLEKVEDFVRTITPGNANWPPETCSTCAWSNWCGCGCDSLFCVRKEDGVHTGDRCDEFKHRYPPKEILEVVEELKDLRKENRVLINWIVQKRHDGELEDDLKEILAMRKAEKETQK